jgi:NAD(P)-dependent dehydrogenase (short-subunit alcohol dehydrogenase family)
MAQGANGYRTLSPKPDAGGAMRTRLHHQHAIVMGAASGIGAHRARMELLFPRRTGTPEEVAHAALFLASDEALFINATDIAFDGGRSQLHHE